MHAGAARIPTLYVVSLGAPYVERVYNGVARRYQEGRYLCNMLHSCNMTGQHAQLGGVPCNLPGRDNASELPKLLWRRPTTGLDVGNVLCESRRRVRPRAADAESPGGAAPSATDLDPLYPDPPPSPPGSITTTTTGCTLEGRPTGSRHPSSSNDCRLARPWITAKAWLMSCGENLKANMASDEGSGTSYECQRNLASLNLRELAGDLSLLAQAAATDKDYDAD
eukprot:6175034-Pleurochrysis_carterae.AAC.1